MERSTLLEISKKYGGYVDTYDTFPVEECRIRFKKRPSLREDSHVINLIDLDIDENRINCQVGSRYSESSFNNLSIKWYSFKSIKEEMDDKQLIDNLEDYLYHIIEKYKINKYL